MFNTINLQNEIIKLKNEKDFCILAHAYMTPDVLEVADFVGDSFGLSQQAQTASQKNILMCGVRFMAETAKILSPDKNIYISHPQAGCPMAEQLTVSQLRKMKSQYKNCAVVAYINTTSELKTECDVCVTSASALNIVKNLPQKEILFIPDCNLGSWIAKNIPEKTFHFVQGGCPIHMRISADDVKKAKELHPHALLLVHPECLKEVTDQADYAGSTTGIMAYARKSDAKEFIIGTENSIVSHLQYEMPDKKFYVLSKACVCEDMRLTTLMDIYNVLRGEGGEEIIMTEEMRIKAKQSIDNMLSFA